jgi:hypothetical protein
MDKVQKPSNSEHTNTVYRHSDILFEVGGKEAGVKSLCHGHHYTIIFMY